VYTTDRGHTVRVILLDCRYNKDPRPLLFNRMTDAQDMLGEEQWRWLENELRSATADFTIIGDGVQLLSNMQEKIVAETFAEYPGSQAKLLSLLAATNTSNALFLSGDVHLAELNKMECDSLPYPLYDMTSSGMTHAIGSIFPEFILSDFLDSPSTKPSKSYTGLNIGELDVVLGDDGFVTMRVYGVDMQVKIEHTVPLAQLQISSQYAASSDVLDCARSSLHSGLPPSCAKVLQGCSGRIPMLRLWKSRLILAFFFSFLISLFAFLCLTPLVLVFSSRHRKLRLLVYTAVWVACVLFYQREKI
jgi:hypothetical protein